MLNGEEEVRGALQEYLEATEEVKKLIHYRGTEADSSTYTEEEFETLRNALKKEAEAKRKYFTLVFERLQWSQKEINEWMEKNI